MRKLLLQGFTIILVGVGAIGVEGQSATKQQPVKAAPSYKATAAYAEIGLRKAELEADLESLLVEYTEEFPKVKEARLILSFLKKGEDRLAAASIEPPHRFTTALGKLIVRKSELESDLARLLETLQPAHPDVRRARRKVEVFESAIKEILG